MDILRFITAGNVDDGKSTLIGRLLYDTQNIKEDTLLSVSKEDERINLAYLTDGLRQERERGITIDVAYKYFYTKSRKYIISDAPGHFQYIKNLVTGASAVDAMIILIDAQNGVTTQTKRHALVAAFLNIPQIIVAINKMDAVDYAESVFNTVRVDFEKLSSGLNVNPAHFIPISALQGDNVYNRSAAMHWYAGPTLIDLLEQSIPQKITANAKRFSVQYVHTTENEQYVYGHVISGEFAVGDNVTIYPSLTSVSITSIVKDCRDAHTTSPGDNVCLVVQGQGSHPCIISRGVIIVGAPESPLLTSKIAVSLCWFHQHSRLAPGQTYLLRVGANEVPCKVLEVAGKFNIEDLRWETCSDAIEVNDLAQVIIETEEVVAIDAHSHIPANGRGILIDSHTFDTVAAFTVNEYKM